MTIPTYKDVQFPILQILGDNNIRKAKDFIEPLAKVFKLTDDDLSKEYPSGNGLIFLDRVYWALSDIKIAGLLNKPKRGLYQINEKGKVYLNDPEKFREYMNKKEKERDKARHKGGTTPPAEPKTDMTPEEALSASFEEIKISKYDEILEIIQSITPRAFEKLVVKLLKNMGYGGEIVESGIVTPYSNDKGIDGIIKEDVLGFGRIGIQAKRYSPVNKIGREVVQMFIGALSDNKLDKGVLITTSDFSKGAYESAGKNNKIILINGRKLAELIYEYNLGMQTDQVFEIKKLDSEYWDNMNNDN